MIEDPAQKIVHFEILDRLGHEIQPRGRSGTGKMYTMSFESIPSQDARLRVYLATPKSVESVPFQLKDVGLP